ncbi:M3 family metallopeptidase [Flavobacterium aurantiibacter]|nr:M3 family metallopeptidase [Flavobacterium aurantiibacter]
MSMFLHSFDTPHESVPFSKIDHNLFESYFDSCISAAWADIQRVIDNPEIPTFENVIRALEFSGQALERLSACFFNLNSAETSETIQKTAQKVSPKLAKFGNDVALNPVLFEKVKYVFENTTANSLTAEEQMLLEKRYKSFVRNGALLSDSEKERLREIDEQLSAFKLKFGENILAENNAYQLVVTNKERLRGLPELALQQAQNLAQQKGIDGYVFTLDFPSYLPFVTYVEDRELRKEISIAAGKKAFQENEFNNEKNVQQIVALRHERARLLGYESHAAFVLEERMAQNPDQVKQFLNTIYDKAMEKARREFIDLQYFAQESDSSLQLQKWDGTFYSEKLKQRLFAIDDEALKPYFPLNQVLEGAFSISEKLYGITFKENDTIEKYHPDVNVYEVFYENGEFCALLYTDFHPRAGKRQGAWMTSFKSQWKTNNENSRPHISIVCNFSEGTADTPALLTFNETTTLFHEFGHALHGMLADTVYPSLSGTSVYWDFVELPSQIFENWCYETEALQTFAKHWQTGEVIPEHFIKSIKAAANFQEGMATVRQLSFGFLDMAYHHDCRGTVDAVKPFEATVFEKTALYPDVAENCMSVSFSHIFNGGYSSGYYSYKWAEVLDADAFGIFKEHGILNRSIGERFKNEILSKGGTVHPMELYKAFAGREPRVEALLERAGLLN